MKPAFLEGPDGQPWTWSRFGRGLRNAFSEFLFEAAVAGVACLLLAGVVAAVLWGWRQHPPATLTLAGAFAALLAYGAWNLRPSARSTRGKLAAIAAGVVVVLLLWLSYVLMYCSCL
jgi:hypothetical protein